MATVSAPRTAVTSSIPADDETTTHRVVVVYNCTRLGRTANPPSFSFSDWFRFGRKR
jgi:hypothetical protein